MPDKIKLVFNSQRGTVFILDDNIISVTGLTGADFNISASSYGQLDGEYVECAKINSRYVTVTFDAAENNRRAIQNFFNVKNTGTLTVIMGNISRFVNYYVNLIDESRPNIYAKSVFKLDLRCVDPFFYDSDDFGKNVASVQPLIAFPFHVTATEPLVADYKIFNGSLIINNSGDEEIGMRIKIVATGAVTNPSFTVNEKTLKLITTLAAGDTLLINTTKPQKEVINKYGFNNLGIVDKTSVFPRLSIGNNVFSYDSALGKTNMEVRVYYRAAYWGV